jgi:hypothetical protein
MQPKQQNGGRELNEVSAPAAFHFKPIFFRLAKAVNQAVPGDLTEVVWPARSNRPARIFTQSYNLSDL